MFDTKKTKKVKHGIFSEVIFSATILILLISVGYYIGFYMGTIKADNYQNAYTAYKQGIQQGYISAQVDMYRDLEKAEKILKDKTYRKNLHKILKELESNKEIYLEGETK